MPSEITARKATLQLEEADAVALEKAVEPTPEEPATPAAPAAVEPKEETIVEDRCSSSYRLGRRCHRKAALRRRLRLAARLRGRPPNLYRLYPSRAGHLGLPSITEKPEEFDTELEDLTELLKAAVNCAARRPYEPPIQCIAAFLLQCEEEPELTEHLDEEEMAALMLAEAPTSAPASAANKMLSVANALSRRGNKAPALHKRSPPSSPTRKEGGSVSFAAALGAAGSSGDKLPPRRTRQYWKAQKGRKTPFLGKEEGGDVFPAVIGTLQEYARRAGRSVRSATRLWSGRLMDAEWIASAGIGK